MKNIVVSILMASTVLVANAQVFQSNGNQNVVGKLFVFPSGIASDDAYNGNIVITKPVTSGQYLNFIRTGTTRWSLGTVYNSNTFAIGQGTTTDASFVSPFFNITQTGNVGIGTTAPSSMLQVAASSGNGLRIGRIGDAGNLAVAIDSLAASYNLDFSGYRDIVLDQIGARIAALRFNKCYVNNALVQNTGLAFYTNPTGLYESTTGLVEQMRIMPNGNLGIGSRNPQYKLDVRGNLYINSGNDDNHIYWGSHSMAMGTPPDDYANNIFALKPGGSTQGELYSRFSMYHSYNRDTTEERVRISSSDFSFFNGGFVGIGIKTPQYLLDVAGAIRAKEVIVTVNGFPDFVFEKNYNLLKLQDVDNYIQLNGHLPNIPSAKEVNKNGINMADLQVKLLQKVEELTLYAIEQQKLVCEQQKRIEQLENALKAN
ncbi:MAG TPA: hypothetical protein VFP20_06135 [Bacteroidales bacterium]|nr:hypothetical protein [Bacteroidales bacterium]